MSLKKVGKKKVSKTGLRDLLKQITKSPSAVHRITKSTLARALHARRPNVAMAVLRRRRKADLVAMVGGFIPISGTPSKIRGFSKKTKRIIAKNAYRHAKHMARIMRTRNRLGQFVKSSLGGSKKSYRY